jgi:type IV pilus assembly protein PilV
MSSAARKRHCVGSRVQSGFTLIEALVAAFVLAVGIMGIVSLLSLSKVSQHESIQRARAVVLADDILERIRRNPAGMSVYRCATFSVEPPDICLEIERKPLGDAGRGAEPVPNCHSATCSKTELAAHDLWTWERLLDGASAIVTDGGAPTVGLRNVSACINFTADDGRQNTGIVDVVIQWQGLQETADAVVSGGTVCGDAAAEDTTRRQVIVNSYVMDETES